MGVGEEGAGGEEAEEGVSRRRSFEGTRLMTGGDVSFEGLGLTGVVLGDSVFSLDEVRLIGLPNVGGSVLSLEEVRLMEGLPKVLVSVELAEVSVILFCELDFDNILCEVRGEPLCQVAAT